MSLLELKRRGPPWVAVGVTPFQFRGRVNVALGQTPTTARPREFHQLFERARSYPRTLRAPRSFADASRNGAPPVALRALPEQMSGRVDVERRKAAPAPISGE